MLKSDFENRMRLAKNDLVNQETFCCWVLSDAFDGKDSYFDDKNTKILQAYRSIINGDDSGGTGMFGTYTLSAN